MVKKYGRKKGKRLRYESDKGKEERREKKIKVRK
jgi:hypothetical protein